MDKLTRTATAKQLLSDDGVQLLKKLGKRFQLQLDYTTTATDGQARAQTINDEIVQLGFSWIPRGDLAL